VTAKLVYGCGYLGERVAAQWTASGHDVWATTRSEDRAARLACDGIRPIVTDVARPFTLPGELTAIDTVLFAVGFDRSADQSIHDVYVGGMRNALNALPRSINRFIYISSTGVYGNSPGEWVDESTPCRPTRPSGQACLEAEAVLGSHPLGAHRIVLRLAGIYGPGRLPKLSSVRDGVPLDASAASFLNLIHVEDAVAVVFAAERFAKLPALYVVSDGTPVLRGDFYGELARLLSAPPPRFIDPSSSSTAGGRSNGDKRICSDRVRQELQLKLKFPSYREGLAAIVAPPGN
jgi:nucleoside-diphosphate-sugar epimerase